jgi:S-adenosylmethionine synthetase
VMVSIETDNWPIKYTWTPITPAVIKNELQLLQPMYYQTAKWGHFGNWFNWDK